MGEIIIWAAIAVLVIVCLRNIVGDLKHGTCSGCSSCGNCSHCGSGCHGHDGQETDHKCMNNDELRQLVKTMQS